MKQQAHPDLYQHQTKPCTLGGKRSKCLTKPSTIKALQFSARAQCLITHWLKVNSEDTAAICTARHEHCHKKVECTCKTSVTVACRLCQVYSTLTEPFTGCKDCQGYERMPGPLHKSIPSRICILSRRCLHFRQACRNRAHRGFCCLGLLNPGTRRGLLLHGNIGFYQGSRYLQHGPPILKLVICSKCTRLEIYTVHACLC